MLHIYLKTGLNKKVDFECEHIEVCAPSAGNTLKKKTLREQ